MKKKIAIIGAGNMGSAIAASLPTDQYDIVCTTATEKTKNRLSAEMPLIEFTRDNIAAVKDADIVVLSVKPYIVDDVIVEVKDHLKEGATIVSVIAPLKMADLEKKLEGESRGLKIIKVIPNTAIRNRKSVTFVTGLESAGRAAVDEVMEIFSHSGKAYHIPEHDMNACTVLASCGIAFFLRFIRAAAEGSVELGLRVAFATEIAALTAISAASLLENGEHPEAEIDKVTTPGGSTIKALNSMEAKGFTPSVIAALKASAGK